MADPAGDVLVDRQNVAVRGVALLLRYVAQRLDRRDVLSEHVQALVVVHQRLLALERLLSQGAAAKTGTVLVLWHAGVSDGPRCISRTFELPNDSKRDAQIEVYHAIPSGAWVVAHDCVLTAVHVGSDAEDLGPMPRGKLVQLRKPVALGERLQVQLMRDSGQLAAGSRYAY